MHGQNSPLFCEAYNTQKDITLAHLGVCYSPFASA